MSDEYIRFVLLSETDRIFAVKKDFITDFAISATSNFKKPTCYDNLLEYIGETNHYGTKRTLTERIQEALDDYNAYYVLVFGDDGDTEGDEYFLFNDSKGRTAFLLKFS